MFTVWNSDGRKREAVQPLHDREIHVYTCGPTVYQAATIANFRTYLFEDVLIRALRWSGYRVTHVMNITDVGHLVGDQDEGEDKVEREAARQGKTAWDLARAYEERFFVDAARLHILRPDVVPRATDHIAEQIALVRQLEEKGYTYRTSDGVYFDTSRFAGYGRLSGQRLEEKEAGARVDVNLEKRHAADFALWKFSPKGVSRQMEWESPWGTGFPGWHIECSAMSVKYLGQPFDIHCGGIDHLPVHHENEIAQSEAANGKTLANIWMHAEFLTVDGRRMGKSEGNAYLLDDVTERGFDPLALRYFYLTAHYRSKLNFTWDALEGAQNALRKLYAFCRTLPAVDPSARICKEAQIASFRLALEDDLNVPQALAALWETVKGDAPPEEKTCALYEMDRVLGLRLDRVIGAVVKIPEEIHTLAEQRKVAREKKNWALSDAIRDQLATRGWSIEDSADHTYRLSKTSA